MILNLTDSHARATRQGILELRAEKPMAIWQEASRLQIRRHHDVRPEIADLKRLGAEIERKSARWIEPAEKAS